MSYDTLRHLADSWGLVFMALVFAVLIGWTFRRGSSEHYKSAGEMIFERDETDG